MANVRITDLANKTSINTGDLFLLVDTVDTSMAPTGTDKTVNFNTLANMVVGSLFVSSVSCLSGSNNSLASIATTVLPINTLKMIVIPIDSTPSIQFWYLQSGTPGTFDIPANDYSYSNAYWTKVGGF